MLATGEAAYADLIERTVYNGFAASTGLDGTSFFYSNPLQVRAEHQAADEEESGQRLPWYACACCPPNVMRLVASLHHYLATANGDGVQLHQYTDADVHLSREAGDIALSMRTLYPWSGHVEITIVSCPNDPWTLALRVPAWATAPRLRVNGSVTTASTERGFLGVSRVWQRGDILTLEFDMVARLTAAHLDVDATRGCVAIERGPLVYCIEAADNVGIDFAAVSVDPNAPLTVTQVDAWPAVVAIAAQGAMRLPSGLPHALYAPAAHEEVITTPVTLTAIPYYLWANRINGPMRVWLPTTD